MPILLPPRLRRSGFLVAELVIYINIAIEKSLEAVTRG